MRRRVRSALHPTFHSLRYAGSHPPHREKFLTTQCHIPGHVLCSTCCHKIVEKTLPRLKPVCPFCREQFTSDHVRLIRIDFSASGYATPRRRGGRQEALDSSFHQPPRFPIVESPFSRTRAEARRLEDKVAAVAAKKCSVEEVSTLHNELQEWLTHDEKQQDDQVCPLYPTADFFHLFFADSCHRFLLLL